MNKKIIFGAALFCAVMVLVPFAIHAAYNYQYSYSPPTINYSYNTPSYAGSYTSSGAYIPPAMVYNYPSYTSTNYNYTNPYNYNTNSSYNYSYTSPSPIMYTNPQPPCNNNGLICPMDARRCSDGSYVSRTGPNCTFPPCPTPVLRPSCPAGYANYGVPLGCVPLSYITYCRYNPMNCPLGPIR